MSDMYDVLHDQYVENCQRKKDGYCHTKNVLDLTKILEM